MQLRLVGDIKYHLLPGTNRKTTDIVIERDGTIAVRPPISMSPEQVDETVLSKRIWIYRNLASWNDLNAQCVKREWVNGETFPYLGSNYRLSLMDHQAEPLVLKNGRFCLLKEIVASGPQSCHEAFERFYTLKGFDHISKRITFFSKKIGVKPGKVLVRDLGFRWATCQAEGDFYFHWKALMAPLSVIDYIVVHELCHLHHRDHSDAFWNEVDKVLPNYRERKEWLRVRGSGLTL